MVKVLIQAWMAGFHMALISSGLKLASYRCSSATIWSLNELVNTISVAYLVPV